MATILQPEILAFLTPIFVFLLVFVILYALLQNFKVLGGNKGFDALAAFAVAILFLITPEGGQFVTLFTPWVLIFSILVFVIFMFFMFLGVSSSSMINVAKHSVFITFAVIFILILFLIALTQVFGPFLLTNADPGFWNATKRAIFHPRALGAILLLVLASFTVTFMASNQ